MRETLVCLPPLINRHCILSMFNNVSVVCVNVSFRPLNTGLARFGEQGKALVSFIGKSHHITPWMLAFEVPKVKASSGIYASRDSSSSEETEDESS